MNRRDFLTLTALAALASKLRLPLAAEGKGNMQYRSLVRQPRSDTISGISDSFPPGGEQRALASARGR